MPEANAEYCPTCGQTVRVVRMLNGTWNVRDERTGAWVREAVGLSKLEAQRVADRLNDLQARRVETAALVIEDAFGWGGPEDLRQRRRDRALEVAAAALAAADAVGQEDRPKNQPGVVFMGCGAGSPPPEPDPRDAEIARLREALEACVDDRIRGPQYEANVRQIVREVLG